jgi:hypothetical protein
MKSIRPEDRPKAIVLVVLVVVVFVGIYMRLGAALGGTPQPAPGAPVSENISPPSGATSTGPGITASSGPAAGAGGKEQIVVPPVSPAARNQDPFRSPTRTEISTNDQTTGQSPKASPPPATIPIRRSGGPGATRITERDLANPTGPIGSGGSSGNGPALPTVGEMKPDEPPPITVTGIVDGGGGRSVAVIRVGAKDYVVANGDHFGDGFRLVEAHPTSVIVTWSKEHRVERKKLSIELPGLSWDGGSGAL